ncbi:MAG: hypothetical protein UU64_C0002G0110 [candidate division WWE3 bacterium GW2011_GWF2_41_45]|uniref:Uncharacterized protein n=1 Tax=candidate division WWE3 bacterium GW2011_GWC2_41_23 TaxID=1619123 RepID=A0A0G0VV37_UNCKA|nr:MAG: hypothetical protein UU55_C0001G0008 [candidate division WWE3 bacterium GW2011_GWC2_41_23]KKS10708.1 MAG: hypothetical protein UU64_C0002G0110 [candidate division WWE3 bacterium GW2011_GWF2_41_45]KKS12281.1 MAG: hypothetical protein UU68_C0002G0007 [candidate division WWE3 bacterium GW2011_GWF1_41_53]KKS20354.1 MAG: hypothetical protein UU79_C0001G0008 [candidate division WWE3 bacterium GW2011_GWE1_41_72]KKS28189.1 MAG: hypothetical protein UU86_C0009G0019 [candidate division WWE3 bacte
MGGEKKETILKLPISVRGIKIPLIKINGNFIKVDNIIAFEGLSVGIEEISSPKEEKQKAANIVAKNIGILIINFPKNKELTKNIGIVIKMPYIKEESTSPKMIAHNFTGDEIILSKVFILVSQGIIPGVIDETVKKRLIPKRPGINDSIDICLFKEKETNKKAGITIPNTITGPLKKDTVRFFFVIAHERFSCSRIIIFIFCQFYKYIFKSWFQGI